MIEYWVPALSSFAKDVDLVFDVIFWIVIAFWFILVEAVFMAIVGAALGILLGLAGAKWPLALHVEQVSGYRLPLYVPWSTIAIAFVASLVIGILASVLPSRRAGNLNVLEAITYE